MYKEYPPSGQLLGKVSCYYILDLPTPTVDPSKQLVTPDGHIELNLPVGYPVLRTEANGRSTELTQPYVLSRYRQHYFVQRTGPLRLIGARFYPWAWQGFASTPLPPDELIEAECIFRGIGALYASLYATADEEQCIHDLDHYLCSRYNGGGDLIVRETCLELLESNGIADMENICRNHYIGRRRLQQGFKENVGISPKMYARMVRFRYTLKLLIDGSFNKLSDIAYINGYTDQSHFIRDFKLFSGINPQNYLRQNTVLNDLTARSAFH